MTFHTLKIEEIFANLSTNHSGLTREEASLRLSKYGPNSIPDQQIVPAYVILLNQFQNILVILLIFASIFAFAIDEIVDSIVILIIVIVNTILGFWQEYKSERAIESLRKIETQNAVVLREGKELNIDPKSIVVGDIVIIATGDKIAADLRIVENINLTIDESLLTGESQTVSKSEAELAESIPLAERSNMLYKGTICVNGRGRGVVVNTGVNTEIGKITSLVSQGKERETPLQKQLAHTTLILARLSIFLILPVIFVGFNQGRSIWELIQLGISLVVSAVPEGLPIIVTIGLSVGIGRMLKQNVLIRRLPIVEILGGADVICTDKTGTITQNKMSLSQIHFGDVTYSVESIGENSQLREILENFILCNDATDSTGDPTEKAFVTAGKNIGIDSTTIRTRDKRTDEVPFSSDTKYMITHHESGKTIVKGALEQTLALCVFYTESTGNKVPLSDEIRSKILAKNSEFASAGMRVLAIACKNGEKMSPKNFTFQALTALIDPPRPEVKQSIADCYAAGVRVIMITGDHALTAEAIAKEVGIESDGVMDGTTLANTSAEELRGVVERISIFARVTSEDKMKILAALQANGHVVAMGGDGVNDAPALKQADIGFAVAAGTDLTKEVSDMVLLDNSFSSIPKAIKEGRVIFQNITSFMKLMLSSNFDEILVIITSIILSIPLPFVPIQILWINLLSDGLPATALSLDQAHDGIMKHHPRGRQASLMKNSLSFLIMAGIFAYISIMLLFSLVYPWWQNNLNEVQLEHARTMVFASSVIFEMFLVFICRTPNFVFGRDLLTNKYLLAAVASSAVLLVAAIYTPFLNPIFKTVPISFADWILVVGIPLIGCGLLEGFKLWHYKGKDF